MFERRVAQYFVSKIDGAWFVVLNGERHGPYDSHEAALLGAIEGSRHTPASQVMVEDEEGVWRAVWEYRIDRVTRG